MSAFTPAASRVRLRFVVALMLVLPFLAHAIWDYVEGAAAPRADRRHRSSGAPTTNEPYRVLSAGAVDADRFYRAAAALVGPTVRRDRRTPTYLVAAAPRSGDWTPDLVGEVRAQLAEHQEALSLADRAAALPFEGVFARLVGGLSDVWPCAVVAALRPARDRARAGGDSERRVRLAV